MNRATIGKKKMMITVLVDDIIVGHAMDDEHGYNDCKELMDELNESDEKCDIVKGCLYDII